MKPNMRPHDDDNYLILLVLCDLLIKKKIEFSRFKRVVRDGLVREELTERERT